MLKLTGSGEMVTGNKILICIIPVTRNPTNAPHPARIWNLESYKGLGLVKERLKKVEEVE